MAEKQIKKICFVVSAEMQAIAFLLPHIKNLSGYYSISIVLNTKNDNFLQEINPKISVFPIFLEREINLISDIKSLIKLYLLFKNNRYDVVHSITPKAGLLSMLASFFARVPIRVHWFTGQVWATKKGLFKLFLKQMDRFIYLFATDVLVDSPSQRNFLVKHRIIKLNNTGVLGSGSVCGVDTAIFKPDKDSALSLRRSIGVSQKSFVILYIGRVSKDKGVANLGHVFSKLAKRYSTLELLIVGPDEGSLKEVLSICRNFLSRVKVVGFTNVPEQFMNSADLLCLPSFREGFGTVVIEAGACEVPSIVTKIYGLNDAIEEGITGLTYDPSNLNEMESKIEKFINNKALRQEMGAASRKRALQYFDQKILIKELESFYQELLQRPSC